MKVEICAESQMKFNYFCINLVNGVPLNTHMHSM